MSSEENSKKSQPPDDVEWGLPILGGPDKSIPLVSVVRELVDPILVSTLLVNADFVRLVGSVLARDKRKVDLYTNILHRQGFEMKVIIAALERVHNRRDKIAT